MNRTIQNLAKSTVLAMLLLGGAHVTAACSGGDVAIGDADDALKQKDAGPDAKDGGPATCAAQGGTCEAITPANNALCGSWGDPASCGGGVGVGCCLHVCPDLVAPSPGFCPGGKVTEKKDASGCSYYDCEAADAGPTNTCTGAGGTCEALTPANNASCPRWGDASKFSCGGGVGVGCCLQACPDLVPPAPGFCSGGNVVVKKDASDCSYYTCDMSDGGVVNDCTNHGGHCTGLSPSACSNFGSYSCGGGVGVGCCLD